MSLVGLNDYSTSYYDQLSDGQQQKVIIGRAVAQNTPIIILDEPTNHLDIGNKAEIFQLLQNLAHNSEKSILVSTHDLSLARQMADELWVIIDGKLVKGSPEKLELEGVLKEAFPYKGIDLISGKFVRLPTKGSIQVVGEGNVKMITEAAMVRIGYSIHEEASLKIEILDGPEWKVFSGSKATTFTDIDNLLRSLK